ncbi:MAG TPA: putative transporter [Rhodopseudomonas sp.]|uniref:putative transporter n=1 Tax=Rhodopseudomonas sp. TaxID=1078 RepID=UPI002ED86E0F
MDWLYGLFFSGEGTVNAVVAMSIVAVCGLAVGEIKIGAVKLGIAGPLFIGLAFGHFGLKMNMHILEFAREFGLILFVYAVGITVGPGFFQAFKKEGVLLNILAASIVIIGGVITVAIHFGFNLPLEVVVGLFSGGTTNTPSLAAGMAMLKEVNATAEQIGIPGQAYAVAYPFGVIGILLTMALIRILFRVNVEASADAWQKEQGANISAVETMSIDVSNARVSGQAFCDLPTVQSHSVVVSRVMHSGTQHVAESDERIAVGDTILAVGSRSKLVELRDALGSEAVVNLQTVPSPIRKQQFVVTRSQVLGKHMDQSMLHGVIITRLTRAGIELVQNPNMKLQFGDQLTCVGTEEQLDRLAKVLGNEVKALQHTQMIPIFLGIFLGVVLGAVPFFVPGLPAAIKLGSAGGPVVVAILLSRIGHIGPLVWHMPPATTNALREFGITMFMCCVGIYAGKSFIGTLVHGDGLLWMACATLITFVPIFVVGVIGRLVFKINYLTLCGVLAGSMTDPPALAFANALSPSDAQATSYAAVYPLTMCLRILTPQIILAAFWVMA